MFCLQVYHVDFSSARWQHHHCVPWTDENMGAKKINENNWGKLLF